MKKFKSHTYSYWNQIGIYIQKGTWCMSKSAWKRYHRQPKPGVEAHIVVFARIPRKIQKEIRRDDGTVHLEDKVIMSRGFIEQHTWDVEDTELIPGKSEVEYKTAYTDWSKIDKTRLIKDIRKEFKVKVEFFKEGMGKYGSASRKAFREVDDIDGNIRINKMYCHNDQMLTIQHELGHILLGHIDPQKRKNHVVQEIEAETVCGLVTMAITGSVDDSTRHYLQGYTKGIQSIESINLLECWNVADRITKLFQNNLIKE
jgi:hypothetical protein